MARIYVVRQRLQGGLEHEFLDLVLNRLDLAGQFSCFVCGDGRGNDRAGDTARTTQCGLGRDENVRYVLVLAEKR